MNCFKLWLRFIFSQRIHFLSVTVLSAIFILSAILHPQEFLDLIPGLLYYITIPSGYLLLMIYSMVNMNIVSWGTRETTKQTKIEKPTGFLHSLIDKRLQEDSLCNKIGVFLSQVKAHLAFLQKLHQGYLFNKYFISHNC